MTKLNRRNAWLKCLRLQIQISNPQRHIPVRIGQRPVWLLSCQPHSPPPNVPHCVVSNSPPVKRWLIVLAVVEHTISNPCRQFALNSSICISGDV